MLNVDSNHCLTWDGLKGWKIAALKDQTRVNGEQRLGHRRTKALVNKSILALSLVTNQAIKSHIVRRIKSLLDYMKK